MKDKILEILLKKWKSSPTAASEIADMVKAFTEWLIEGDFYELFEQSIDESGINHYECLKDGEIYSFDELFNYWYDNIYKSTDK